MSTIKYPGKHDVMLGRGGESNYHSGNIAFRHMVQKYKERFRLGSRTEKNKVIDEVVSEWRNQDPVGRFVAKKTTDTGEVVWYDVGNEQAKKRAAKSLAEWTPQSSFQSGSGKKSPTQERKKRSRGATASTASSPDFFPQQPQSNKRQNRAMLPPPTPVNSFTVMNMASAQQQQQQEQHHQQLPHEQLQPLPLFSQAADQDFLSSAVAASAQDYFPSASTTASANTQPAAAAPTNSMNQPCNINSMDVLPIERIRLQLPTAAELASSAFSDDDKSWHSNSSRGSNHGNGLLPNKSDMMMKITMDNFNFKETTSSNLQVARDPPTMGCFGGQTLWMI